MRAWLAALGVAGPLAALSGCASLERPGPPAGLVPERVSFASLDRDAAGGAPVVIQALLFRPAGPPEIRRGAVVALHGCGGMYSTLASRRSRLSQRHQAMAELLVASGYVVLFPDSFRSRGLEEICTVEPRRRAITVTQRRLDAQAALAFLQARGDVAPDRIAALGWSHGGITTLATLDAKAAPVRAWRNRPGAPPYYRAAIAFYPGCRDALSARGGYALAAPLLLLVAGADDWTAAQPCVDLARGLEAAGEPVAITVYPDVFHGFDGPPGQPRQRLDVPGGVRPGQGVTIAADPAARENAYARVQAFLARELAAPKAGAGYWSAGRTGDAPPI